VRFRREFCPIWRTIRGKSGRARSRRQGVGAGRRHGYSRGMPVAQLRRRERLRPAIAALGADAARSEPAVQHAFADGLEPLIDLLAQSAPGRSKAERRRKGVAAMAGLVGALLLARAVGKGELSDEILEAMRRELLAAG